MGLLQVPGKVIGTLYPPPSLSTYARFVTCWGPVTAAGVTLGTLDRHELCGSDVEDYVFVSLDHPLQVG